MAVRAKSLLPLFDRVLVERVVAQSKTATGLFLPDASTTKLNEAVVVAVGSGRTTSTGVTIAPVVKPGDRVLLPEYGGSPIKLGDKELTLFREEDLLGILH
eukprot:TRINITY_DN384_c0_g1_i1.p1 TRINITY_DN384_c0_g1~~TRINITY_DN384_c0_g1_i1.p1  ORF type:complete len:101 (+),score=24.85 TRINITY_DN384_c0_g1_i1:90-392(+)